MWAHKWAGRGALSLNGSVCKYIIHVHPANTNIFYLSLFLIHYIETFPPTCLKLGERILGYVVIFLRGSCLLTLQALNGTNDSSRNKITLTLAENIPRGVTKQGKIANVSLWQNCLTGEKAFTVMSSLHHPQRTFPPHSISDGQYGCSYKILRWLNFIIQNVTCSERITEVYKLEELLNDVLAANKLVL